MSTTNDGQQIWNRYRFTHNHLAKYLGQSIHTTTRTDSPIPAQAGI